MKVASCRLFLRTPVSPHPLFMASYKVTLINAKENLNKTIEVPDDQYILDQDTKSPFANFRDNVL
jgi:hypothetical protein